MSDYKYDNPDDAYKEAKRLIKQAKGGFFKEAATELYLEGLGLTAVPPEICQLTNLTQLDLYDNKLTAVPSEIWQLTNLMKLNLSGNKLTTVPSEIAQLINLEYLIFGDINGGNMIRELPPEIAQLTNLERLELVNNQLIAVPLGIIQLINLRLLDLSNNALTTVPSEITQLTSLAFLSLYNNQLTTIPPEIGQLTNLGELNLGNNQLTTIPPEIGQLTNLGELNLNKNKLTIVPSEIGQLTNLVGLHLFNNQLTVIPSEIGRLMNLRKLNLRYNRLTEFPLEFTQLKLRILGLKGNPDLSIPPEILEQDDNPQAIFDYLEALSPQPENQPEPPDFVKTTVSRKENQPQKDKQPQEKERLVDTPHPLNEAKLILVGQGGVGKTSLVKRLVADEFDPQEDQTMGIRVEKWQVDVPRPNQEPPTPIQLNIWDFGGQEIMHATHQFFLTKRSLYLLVLDARQGEHEGRITYWLSLINSFAADAPILIVINKIDQQALPVDESGLKKKHPSIVGFISVSARSGQGIDGLKAAIVHELSTMKHIDTLFPASWMRVKEALAALQTERTFLPYHEYEQLCQQCGVAEESQQRTLLRFLHDLGLALNFQDDDRVGDTSVLNPSWVTDGVYALLNSPLLQAQHGILRRDQLSDILPAAAYPRSQHRFLLDMMLKFELAYPLDQDRLLIPDLLSKEEPSYKWEDEDALHFAYQYRILPRGILHRFMVRQYMVVDSAIRWRTGVLMSHGDLSALAKADIEGKKIHIAINGNGDRKQFLYSLRLAFAGIHDSIAGVKPKEVVPIPGYPDAPPISYQYLQQLKDSGIEMVPIEGVDGLVNIGQLLGTVTTIAMRQTGLPTGPKIFAGLKTFFSGEEFDVLLFELNVDGDDLEGKSPNARKMDCVKYMERRGNLAALVEAMEKQRPRAELW